MSWFLNLLSGWLPIGVNSEGKQKSFGEWSGKIVWVVGIVVVILVIDKFFNKPQPINVASGGIVQVGEQRDTMGIGCNAWRLYIKGGIKAK